MSDIKEGAVFKLRTDVVNPEGDRRTKHDPETLPVWKEGTVFLIKYFNGRKEIRIHGMHGYVCEEKSVALMLANADPVDDLYHQLWSIREITYVTTKEIVEQLVKLGKISRDDIQAAVNAQLAEESAKAEARGQ